MMSDKMNAVNDEDMIRMAFRVLDKYGTGTISSKSFKHLMTHIGNTGCPKKVGFLVFLGYLGGFISNRKMSEKV